MERGQKFEISVRKLFKILMKMVFPFFLLEKRGKLFKHENFWCSLLILLLLLLTSLYHFSGVLKDHFIFWAATRV